MRVYIYIYIYIYRVVQYMYTYIYIYTHTYTYNIVVHRDSRKDHTCDAHLYLILLCASEMPGIQARPPAARSASSGAAAAPGPGGEPLGRGAHQERGGPHAGVVKNGETPKWLALVNGLPRTRTKTCGPIPGG